MTTIKHVPTGIHLTDPQRAAFNRIYADTVLQRCDFDHIAVIFNGRNVVAAMPYKGNMPKAVWTEAVRLTTPGKTLLVMDCVTSTYQVAHVHYEYDGLVMKIGAYVSF